MLPTPVEIRLGYRLEFNQRIVDGARKRLSQICAGLEMFARHGYAPHVQAL